MSKGYVLPTFGYLYILGLLLAFLFVLSSCNTEYVPKPSGYFRIELPQKSYIHYDSRCPLSFEVPTYASMELFENRLSSDSCWFNIFYKRFNARLHCTYMPVKGNIDLLIKDAYGFAISHEMKASALRRTPVADSARAVYGMLYDIDGEAATQLQFYLTDSSRHFFRGSLYFFNTPNADSIEPVLKFLRQDLVRMTETLEWRRN